MRLALARLAIFMALFAPLLAEAAIPTGERNALIAIYNATGGESWSNRANWLGAAGTECTWAGVTCDESQSFVALLDLSNNNLTGTIPSDVGSLSKLTMLGLYSNSLSGSIPSTVGNLRLLRYFYLAENDLTGSIPSSLGTLSNLEELYLNNNALSGPLPSSLGSLSKLQILSLDYNSISGPIPDSFGGLSALRQLSITENALTGSIPSQLGNLSQLVELRLSDNDLSGTIPSQLTQLLNLERLELAANSLTGNIPSGIGAMAKLTHVYLDRNELSGEIPSSIGQLANLTLLELSYQSLTGAIPVSLVQLSNLEELGLNDNSFTGSIPKELASLRKLRRLQLENNALTGTIPPELGQLTALEDLRLYGNDLTGTIPKELGQLTNLQILFLDSLALTGTIPQELGNLKKLRMLYAGNTELGGTLDIVLQMTALEELSLEGASFTGPIPSGISQLTHFWYLDLSDNDLSGQLPRSLGDLSNLNWLDLGGNEFTGPIPTELGRLSNLMGLSLWGGLLSGPIPSALGDLANLEDLDLSYNSLSGSIPSELGRLSKLQYLTLNDNDLTGPIPSSLGQLGALLGLQLGMNSLEGPIPASLGDLANLETLDLYSGFLSGPIPPELAKLSRLQYLGLASNLLTGSIPSSFGQLESLRDLHLGDNSLDGSIPTSIGDLGNLEVLVLSFNSISGAIPSSLTNLTKLQYLALDGNKFEGPLPATLGQLTSLHELWLGLNTFSGEIPLPLANLVNVEDGLFDLRYNALHTSNASLRAFLDRKHGGTWEDTQTVTPTNLKIATSKGDSVILTWTPISYVYDEGGYQVEVGTTAAGPFKVATMTESKNFSAEVVEELQPQTQYFFRIRAVTWGHDSQQNDIISDPTPVVSTSTTAAVLAPASVVVYYFPYGMVQNANEAGATDSYTLTNVGDVATTVTMSQSGTFFTQGPSSIPLGPGESADVQITAIAQSAGAYSGASIPTGDGVPAGLSIPIRLLSVVSSGGDVAAEADVNRIDLSAPAGQNPTGSVTFTNEGTGTLVGIAVANASWIVPTVDLISIPAGQSLTVPFSIDRAKRPDASDLAGTATGQMSLVYAKAGTGATKLLRDALEGAPGVGVGATVVVVADTVVPGSASSTIPPLGATDVALFIPGAGHVTSGSGLFISDLAMTNAFGLQTLSDMRMYFTPSADYQGSTTTVVALGTIEPTQGLAFANVVRSVVGQPERVGTLQLRSRDWDKLSINASIFNVSNPRGTYGNTIPVFRSDRALAPGQSLYITGLQKDATMRTNLFIQETSGTGATFAIVFYDAQGAIVPVTDAGTAQQSLRGTASAFQMVRSLNQVPAGALTAKVTNEGAGRIVAYATPVDGASRDTWSLVDWSLYYRSDPSKVAIIPVAGSLRGANNNFFRTDVSFMNSSGQHGRAKLEYWLQGGGRIERTIDIDAGRSVVYADIAGGLFAAPSTVGFVRVTPQGGSFLATSRTYATVDGVDGTFGMGVPIVDPATALRLGQSKVIGNVEIAAREAILAKRPGTFRTNIGIVEIDGKPVTVRITLSAVETSTVAYTAILATQDITLAPNEFRLFGIRDAMLQAKPGSLRNVAVTFRVVDGTGGLVAFTSSVDNGSGDTTLRMD
ncbi:MAG: leucine-rich repeat domain-containing protein [Thermoanaerobaculia bacterium]